MRVLRRMEGRCCKAGRGRTASAKETSGRRARKRSAGTRRVKGEIRGCICGAYFRVLLKPDCHHMLRRKMIRIKCSARHFIISDLHLIQDLSLLGLSHSTRIHLRLTNAPQLHTTTAVPTLLCHALLTQYYRKASTLTQWQKKGANPSHSLHLINLQSSKP